MTLTSALAVALTAFAVTTCTAHGENYDPAQLKMFREYAHFRKSIAPKLTSKQLYMSARAAQLTADCGDSIGDDNFSTYIDERAEQGDTLAGKMSAALYDIDVKRCPENHRPRAAVAPPVLNYDKILKARKSR